VAAGLAIAMPAVSAQSPAPPAQGTIIQQIIVKVNGDIFTKTDLESRQIVALRDKNLVVDPAKGLNDAALKAALLDVTPDLLVEAVDELLQVQRAHELGFRMSDENFKSIVENIKKQNKLDDAGLRAALQQEGLSFEEFRSNIDHRVLIQQLQSEVMSRLALTEQEAHDYYDKHHDEFMTEPTVSLREILIAVPAQSPTGFNAGIDQAALDKANAVRERALKGEDFVKLLGEVSDSPSKASGGLIAGLHLKDVDPKFRAALEKLKVGEITEPLRTTQGYQIFKLDAATPAELQPFDKVHSEIVQKVQGARMEAEMAKYVQHLRAQALIEWKHEDMRKMYEKRLAEMKSAGQ
jgi:peptidyl-prolyl cis-trans isomerase SurA